MSCVSGGFKLWEGSVDMCKALCEVFKLDADSLSSPNTLGDLEVGARGAVCARGVSLRSDDIPRSRASRTSVLRYPSSGWVRVGHSFIIAQGKKVLELGCGHGLPGILCLLAGADVHFQVRGSEGPSHERFGRAVLCPP